MTADLRLTTAELDELERLEKAATAGEWHTDGNLVEKWIDMGIEPECVADTISSADAAMIAAARNALPALLLAARELLDRKAADDKITGQGSANCPIPKPQPLGLGAADV